MSAAQAAGAPVNILNVLKADYAQFPRNQTYALYDPQVYFKDPWISFRGVTQYRWMIGFIERSFLDVRMELHDIRQVDDLIQSDWTLSWIAPLPWKPALSISGRSELTLNAAGLIQSHVDFWNCSRWDVVKQLFSR
ncbi:MAG: DUF2358 domain-containing protein [Thermosynechococcaceae cyanobacterium MS004]|nr:DUF2358 domain-containing protein [Thermosynechococcaceae cyanobacterium MS004]